MKSQDKAIGILEKIEKYDKVEKAINDLMAALEAANMSDCAEDVQTLKYRILNNTLNKIL